MSDLLKLELENVDAKALAAPYQNIEDRKEIFLKYLIVEAIKSKADIIDIQDSLFYSKKFYSLTRLFDFYVNNNVFDLIIVKPDEDELLFDIIQDDIHSNIYGYAVARVGANFETAELLGYFMAKDFNSIVNGKKINVKNLLAIDNFENIEILDSQMSLDDVSERYFELLSGFMDDDLDEAGLAELACLLCNSSELREAFSEIGRFDSLCEDMKNNSDLLEDNFLSIIGGESTDETLEQKENKTISIEKETLTDDDLSLLIDSEPIKIEIDSNDLSLSIEPLENIESDNQKQTIATENEIEDIESLSELEEELLSNANNDAELSEFAETSNTLHDDNLNNDVVFNLDDIAKNETTPEPINNEVILDDIVGDLHFEEQDTTHELSNILGLEKLEDTTLNIPTEEKVQEQSDEELITDETIETLAMVADTEDTIQLDIDEIEPLVDPSFETLEEDESEYLSLDLDEDSNIIEPKNEKVNTTSNRLSAELASLSLKLEKEEDVSKEPAIIEIVEETDVSPLEELSIIEEQSTATLKNNDNTQLQEQTNSISLENISDELIELLKDDNNSDISVNDDELYSILGMSNNQPDQTSEQEYNNLEVERGKTANNAPISLITENAPSKALNIQENENVSSNNDISLLYASDSDSLKHQNKTEVEVEEIPIGYKNITKRQNNKKTLVVVAALALLVVAGIGVSLTSSKTAQNDYEDTIADNEIVQKKESIKPVSRPAVSESFEDDEDILPSNISTEKETKIETSRSNQSGAAPVILKAVAWQVPTSISNDAIFNKYLQIAGKNIKLNLATDLLDTDDFAYNNKIKISMTVKNNMPVKNIKVVESSGSRNVDDIVLQSIKQTLKYINTPVMSEDRGDREVILVISI